MSSTFFGISIAQSALAAQRRAMDVLGYNIAHANDPTYKRQRMVLAEGAVLAQSSESSSLSASAFGGGVNCGDVQRIRDALVENRLVNATQASANWEYRSSTMSQLEAAIGEPSDTGLQADLDNFWNSWQKVATTPDSLPLRSSLLEDTSALCQRLHYVYRQMSDVVTDLNLSAGEHVDQINLYAEEIGRLNDQIGSLPSGEMSSNDLLNRRDALVLELSKLAAISQHGDDSNNFVVSIGGRVLIQGTLVNRLTTESVDGTQSIRWERDGEAVSIQGGELRAILDLRDTMIPSYLSQLDTVATSLVEGVNTLHNGGRDMSGAAGGDFFRAGTTAANIALDPDILDHPELIAASATGALGDGDVARQISALKDTAVSGEMTINQMYRTLIGDMGSATATAETQAEAQKLSLDQYTTQQQSVSGVSLDEEMTNMVKFQQAYNSAARVLTVMDEMLDVLVSRTGAVGR